jgi:SAM-dependent methyltransferase
MAITRIAQAKGFAERTITVHVRDEQARDLTFDQLFDLIVSMGVLHHTPYAPQIVQNLTRFLKDEGIFQVMLYNYHYLHSQETTAGKRLNESSFGAVTDPVVGHLRNPYSEPYDDAKAQQLFQGYERISADYPNPYYNTYRFKKLPTTEIHRNATS